MQVITTEQQMVQAFEYGFIELLRNGGMSQEYVAHLTELVSAQWPAVEVTALVDMLTRFDVALRCALCGRLARPNPFLSPHRLGEGEPTQVTFSCGCARATKATTSPTTNPIVKRASQSRYMGNHAKS